MNMISRLFFVALSAIGFGIFGWGCASSHGLLDGQNLMLWSLFPASLMLFAGAFHTKKNANEVIAVMVMLVGAFFAMLSFGMFKQTGDLAYIAFAGLGLALCGSSIAVLVLETLSPCTIFSRS